jgi:hypothetical protein
MPSNHQSFEVGEVLSEAWRLFARDPGVYILATLVYTGITMVTCGLAIFVLGVFLGGITGMGLQAQRGEPVSYNDAFAGFRRFGDLFLLWIVMLSAVSIGYVLCILPGIYLTLAFYMAAPLIVDRRMNFLEAMTESLRAFHANLGPMLLTTFVLFLIYVFGQAIPLGFLVVQPLYILGGTVLYARTFGLNPQAAASPARVDVL